MGGNYTADELHVNFQDKRLDASIDLNITKYYLISELFKLFLCYHQVILMLSFILCAKS